MAQTSSTSGNQPREIPRQRAAHRLAVWIFVGLLLAGYAGLIISDRQRVAAGDSGLRLSDSQGELTAADTATGMRAYLDGNSVSDPRQPDTLTLTGFVWLPRAGTYTFILHTDGRAALWVDDQTLIDDSTTHEMAAVSAAARDFPAGPLPIRIDWSYAPESSLRPQIDLWWQPVGGVTRRVPAWALFTRAPNAAELARAGHWRMAYSFTYGLMLLGAVGLVGLLVYRFIAGDMDRRETLGLLAVFALAFALRAIFILHRAGSDPEFFTLGGGTDNRTYEYLVRLLERGLWPGDDAYYYQPGISYFMYGLRLIAGPDLLANRLLTALITSSTAPAAYAIGRSLFDRRAGWVAAILMAIYPVAIFYTGTGLITPVAIWWSVLVLWRLAALADRPTWLNAGLAGALCGAMIATRQNLLPFLPLVAVWMWFALQDAPIQKRVGLALAVVLTAAAVHLPFSLHNYASGAHTPLATAGATQWYLGNNRDTRGVYYESQAYRVARRLNIPPQEAFLADLRAEPLRWPQILVYKLGVFWQTGEFVSNVGYHSNGTEVSWLLRLLQPFNFTVLTALGFSGVGLALIDRKHRAWLLYLFIATMVVTTVAYTPESRHRAPVIAGLVPLAGYALVAAYGALRPRLDRTRLLTLGKIGVGVGVLLVLLRLANRELPLPRLVAADTLPADMTRLDLTFGDEITLIGYQVVVGADEVAPGDPLLLRLYWQRLRPMTTDYSVFLDLVGPDGTLYGKKDSVIGTISMQPTPTSQWHSNRVFWEEYAVNVRSFTPTPLAGEIWVGVYQKETLERLDIPGTDSDTLPIYTVRVQDGPLVQDGSLTNPLVVDVGGWATLEGYTMARQPAALEVTLTWVVTETPPTDYTVYLHLFDAAGNLVAQADGMPFAGHFPTGVWRAGDHLHDTFSIMLPPELPSGTYTLNTGLYDTALNRVALTSREGQPVPDNSLRLTEVSLP